jgi:hypothetical protein
MTFIHAQAICSDNLVPAGNIRKANPRFEAPMEGEDYDTPHSEMVEL